MWELCTHLSAGYQRGAVGLLSLSCHPGLCLPYLFIFCSFTLFRGLSISMEWCFLCLGEHRHLLNSGVLYKWGAGTSARARIHNRQWWAAHQSHETQPHPYTILHAQSLAIAKISFKSVQFSLSWESGPCHFRDDKWTVFPCSSQDLMSNTLWDISPLIFVPSSGSYVKNLLVG